MGGTEPPDLKLPVIVDGSQVDGMSSVSNPRNASNSKHYNGKSMEIITLNNKEMERKNDWKNEETITNNTDNKFETSCVSAPPVLNMHEVKLQRRHVFGISCECIFTWILFSTLLYISAVSGVTNYLDGSGRSVRVFVGACQLGACLSPPILFLVDDLGITQKWLIGGLACVFIGFAPDINKSWIGNVNVFAKRLYELKYGKAVVYYPLYI